MSYQKPNYKIKTVTVILILLLATKSTNSLDIECNVRYEQQRTCKCNTVLSRYEQSLAVENSDLSPTTSYEYCDNDDLSYHQCFRESCDSECERSVKSLNGVGDLGLIGKEAADRVCEWGVGGNSITETGLDIWAQSQPGECERRLKLISKEKICCNRKCSCGVKTSNGDLLVDLGNWLSREAGSFYDCSRSEMAECEKECRSVLAEYLELKTDKMDDVLRNEYDLDGYPEAGNKLCSLFGERVAYPGLGVELVVDTKPGELSLSKQISLGRICCQLECECRLQAGTSAQLDLSHMLKLPNLFYECSSQSAMCKQECMRVANAFLLEPQNMHNNFDLLTKNPSTAGGQLCSKLMNDTQVVRPGIDAFLSVSDEEEQVFIGKLCCSRPCSCSLVVKNDKNLANKTLISLEPFLGQSGFYKCSQEESECARDCQRAAGVYLENEELLKESSASVQSLNVFFQFKSAVKMCQLVGSEVLEPGVDVYLRYDTGSVRYPASRDVHVGRVCCNHFLFPANKCKYQLLPDMDS